MAAVGQVVKYNRPDSLTFNAIVYAIEGPEHVSIVYVDPVQFDPGDGKPARLTVVNIQTLTPGPNGFVTII